MDKVNGIACGVVPVSDRGLAYGDGVWETLVIRDHKLKQLDKHFERLQKGLSALAITNVDLKSIKQELSNLEIENDCVVVKVIIT